MTEIFGFADIIYCLRVAVKYRLQELIIREIFSRSPTATDIWFWFSIYKATTFRVRFDSLDDIFSRISFWYFRRLATSYPPVSIPDYTRHTMSSSSPHHYACLFSLLTFLAAIISLFTLICYFHFASRDIWYQYCRQVIKTKFILHGRYIDIFIISYIDITAKASASKLASLYNKKTSRQLGPEF